MKERVRLKECFSGVKVVDWDFDGVLINSAKPVLERQCEVWKEKYNLDAIKGWDWTYHMSLKYGLTQEEAIKLQNDTWMNSVVLSKSEPLFGAWALSYRFYRMGISQHITTSRLPSLKECTYDSVNRYYPWIPLENVHVRDGTNIDKDQFKVDWVRRMFANLHFEDNRIQARLIAENTSATVIYLPYPDDKGSLKDLVNIIEVPRVSGFPNLWKAYQIINESNYRNVAQY